MKRPGNIGRWFIPLSLLCGLAHGCDNQSGPPERARKGKASKAFQKGAAKYNQTTYTHWTETDFQLSLQMVQRHENPDEVMELLDLQPGMVVSDIGCGVGFYTFRFAQAVGPTGKIHAIDIVDQAVEVVQSRAKSTTINPHSNVVATLSDIDNTRLDTDSLDVGFFSHMGWYMAPKLLPENVRMLADTYRVIRPGGVLVVLQFSRKEVDPTYIKPNIEGAGFTLERAVDLKEGGSVLYFFRKPSPQP